MAGARWAQKEILDKHPGEKLRVYAIWFNMLPSDDRSRWPEGLFHDPRVVEYWDEQLIVGAWFGRHPDYLDGNEVLWDSYLLYGPESRWTDRPSHRVSWGYTIVRTRKQLQRDLESLLKRARSR